MNTFLSPEPVVIELRNAVGSVTVDLQDTTTTTVEVIADADGSGFLDDVVRMWGGGGRGTQPEPGSLGEAVYDVVVEFENNRLIVDTEPARRRWRVGFVVRVTAPLESSVRTRTETANVAVRGIPDKIEVKSAAGTIDVQHSGRHAVLSTVSGDVDVHEAGAGSVELSAVSGSLSVGVQSGVPARVALFTVSGRVRSELEVSQTKTDTTLSINGRTVSGDVTLRRASLV